MCRHVNNIFSCTFCSLMVFWNCLVLIRGYLLEFACLKCIGITFSHRGIGAYVIDEFLRKKKIGIMDLLFDPDPLKPLVFLLTYVNIMHTGLEI